MGGAYLDNPDPRLSARAEKPLSKEATRIESEGLRMMSETNNPPVDDMARAKPVETATLTADDKEAAVGANDECTPTSSSSNSYLEHYVVALHAQIVQLTKEKAEALQECVQLQKAHIDTTFKYKDAHARWNDINQIRINLDKSLAKRISEKNEAIEQIAALREKNVHLLQKHADLCDDNALLKTHNATLVEALQPREARIMELEAEVTSLKESQKREDSEREQCRPVKAQGDVIKEERDAMPEKVETHDQTQRRCCDPERGRSRYRTRSPRRSPGRDNWRATRHEDYRDLGYRERSRDQSRYREQDSQMRDHYGNRYQLYEHRRNEFTGPPTSPRRREPSRTARRDPSRTSPRESDRPPTPRETPETAARANLVSSYDFPNMGKGKDESNKSGIPTGPNKIPKGPRAGVLFSMGEIEKKTHTRRPAKKKNGRQ